MCCVAKSLWLLCALLSVVHCNNDSSYRREVLITGVREPREIAINWRDNILYFNYENTTIGDRISAILDLETKKYYDIKELRGDCTHKVDQNSGKAFAACRSNLGTGGVYQYDPAARQFVIVAAKGEDCLFVHYGEGVLYYSCGEGYRVHTYSQHSITIPPQIANTTIWELVIDSAGGWVYYNSLADMYRLSPATGVITRYVDAVSDVANSTGRWLALVLSPSGDAYATDNYRNAIYRTDADGKLWRVADAPHCNGLTFDAYSNIIYTDYDNHSIIRLTKW